VLHGVVFLTISRSAILIADEHAESESLLYFLPHRFGLDDLEESMPPVFQTHFNGLAFRSMNSPGLNLKCNDGDVKEDALNLCNGDVDVKEEDIHNPSGSEDLHQLKVAALKVANLSHAPYSKCPSGIALMTTKGDICTGFYIESAAFNPSLFPLQDGIIAFLCQDGENYEDIVYAVLVEKEGVVVQQGDTIKLALQKFFPKCSFHLFNCYKE